MKPISGQDLSSLCWNICLRKERKTWHLARLKCNVYSARTLTVSKALTSILSLFSKESFGFSKTQTLKQFHNCHSVHLKSTFPMSSAHQQSHAVWGGGGYASCGVSTSSAWRAIHSQMLHLRRMSLEKWGPPIRGKCKLCFCHDFNSCAFLHSGIDALFYLTAGKEMIV